MGKILWIIIFSVYGLAASADPFLLTEKLKAKGFTCVAQANGDICTISNVKSAQFNYPQPVAILIPKNVRSPDKVLLHIHGFRGVCESNSVSAGEMANNFQFLNQMKQAGATNSVMVLPMSTGKETTYNNSLVPQFTKFTQWVDSQVQPTTKRWVVSGHSGAGSVISKALTGNSNFTKRVDSVLLMDATYGDHTSEWKNLTTVNPGIRIDSIYRGGTATERGSQALTSNLPKGSAKIQRTSERHCQIPKTQYGAMLARNTSSASSAAVKASSSVSALGK